MWTGLERRLRNLAAVRCKTPASRVHCASMPGETAGQRRQFASNPTFSSRDTSGLRIGGLKPSVWVRHMETLTSLVAGIGQGWICRETAAAIYQWEGFRLEPPFHFLVPRGRAVHRVHHYIHTSAWIPLLHQESQHGLPITSPTRTLIDIASFVEHKRLVAALESAYRTGGTHPDFLHRQIAVHRSRGVKGIERLLAAMETVELTRGCESWLESTFVTMIVGAGLPRPDVQVIVGKRGTKLIRVDCRFPGTPVVVELLGYRFHRTELQMRNDAERMNKMIAQGLLPTQFTYVHVRDHPNYVLATVIEALAPYIQ